MFLRLFLVKIKFLRFQSDFQSDFHFFFQTPFCVPAKVTKLVGLKNRGLVSPTNLITFAGTKKG
jgi:hypothetical protein